MFRPTTLDRSVMYMYITCMYETFLIDGKPNAQFLSM